MGAIKQAKARLGGDYLSLVDKERLLAQRTVFVIEDVVYEEESKYGPRWVLKIGLDDGTWLLTMSSTPARDQTFNNLLNASALPCEAVLVKAKTKAGLTYYDLQDPDESDELPF